MGPEPQDGDVGLNSLKESLDETNEMLKHINVELQRLDRNNLLNRIFSIVLGLVVASVVIIFIWFWHDSNQQERAIAQAFLDGCLRGNDLRAAIIEEENRFIEALAEITEADSAIVMSLQENLTERRAGVLDPVDCGDVINN